VRRTVLPWLLAVALGGLGACKKSSPEAGGGPTPLRVQLNWLPEPEFGGLYAAALGGHFAAEGLEVTLIAGSAGVAAPQLAASGQVDFAVVNGDQVVTLRAQGAPLVAVHAAFQTSPRAVMVRAGHPAADLRALWTQPGRIALEPGLPFARWLDQHFGPRVPQAVPSGGGLAAFLADASLAQAVYVFAEPVETAQRGVPVRVFPVAETGYDPYAAVLATRESMVRERRAVVEAMVRAVRRGWADYLVAPAAVNAHMATLNPSMGAAAMDRAVDAARPYLLGPAGEAGGAMAAARWETLIGQLVALGVVERERAPTATSCFVAL
jgi:NitT/TauT family transport system substrate-binding protein